jgi:hypothetical protein
MVAPTVPCTGTSTGATKSLPMRLPVAAAFSANHTWPSGPAATPTGWVSTEGIGNSVMTPVVVILPILLPTVSANHRLFDCAGFGSGPETMAFGLLPGVGIAYSVNAPATVRRPIRLPVNSVNQIAPSGPTVGSHGTLLGCGISCSASSTPAVLMRPTRFPACSVNHRLPSGPATIPSGRLPVRTT